MALYPQEKCGVTVNELQQLNFSQLSLHEKVTIKERGRSTPNILISQPGISNNKKYIRSFHYEWYKRKNWLCGCEVENALFCFPCLLFGGDATWTKDGFRNINKIKEKTEKHENSKKHVDNVLSLTLLGTHESSSKEIDSSDSSKNKLADSVYFSTSNTGNIEMPPGPMNKKSIAEKKADILEKLCELLSHSQKQDEVSLVMDPMAILWTQKLHSLNSTQRILAEKAINDILFEAQFNNLHCDSVQMNILPHINMPSLVEIKPHRNYTPAPTISVVRCQLSKDEDEL